MIALYAGAITGVLGAAATIGMQVDRPAWKSEVVQLAGEVRQIDARITTETLNGVQTRIYQNEREQQAYQKRGEAVPNYLIQERARLESDRRSLERKLEELQ